MRGIIAITLLLSILFCAMYSTSAQSPLQNFLGKVQRHCQRPRRQPRKEEDDDSMLEVVPRLRQLSHFIRQSQQRPRPVRRQLKKTCNRKPKRTAAQKRLAKRLLSKLRTTIRTLIRRLTVIGSELREEKLDMLNEFINKLRKLHKKARRPKYAFNKLLDQLFEEIPPADQVGDDVHQVIEESLGNVEALAKRVAPILSHRFFYLPYSIRNAARGLSLMIKNLKKRSDKYPDSDGLIKATSKRLRAMITDLKRPVLEQHFFRVRELLKQLPTALRKRFMGTFTKRYTHALSAREDLTLLQRKDFREYVMYLRKRVREFIRTLRGKRQSKAEPKLVKQVTQYLARMRSVFARNNNTYGKLMRRALQSAKKIQDKRFAGYVRRSLFELRDKVKRLRRFFKPKQVLPKLIRQARKGLRHLSARLLKRFPEEEGVQMLSTVIRKVRDLAKKNNQFSKIKQLFKQLRVVLKANAKLLGRKTIDKFKDFYYQIEEHYKGKKSKKRTPKKNTSRKAKCGKKTSQPRRRRFVSRPARQIEQEDDQ